MAPLNLETGGHGVIRHIFLAFHRALISCIQRATETIALTISALGVQSPRALRVYLAQELDINFIIDSEVPSTITQVETAIGLVAEGRYNQTAGVFTGEGEESIGNS